MSVLGNTKSNRYRKTHHTSLAARAESFSTLPGEVSKSRSSEEVSVMEMELRSEESSSLLLSMA